MIKPKYKQGDLVCWETIDAIEFGKILKVFKTREEATPCWKQIENIPSDAELDIVFPSEDFKPPYYLIQVPNGYESMLFENGQLAVISETEIIRKVKRVGE